MIFFKHTDIRKSKKFFIFFNKIYMTNWTTTI